MQVHICDRKVTFPMLRVGEQKITRRTFVIESAFLAAFDTHHPPHPPFNVGAGELSRVPAPACAAGLALARAPTLNGGCGGIAGMISRAKLDQIQRGQNGLKEVRMHFWGALPGRTANTP